MKPLITLIAKYTILLLTILLIQWWLLFFSPFNIPEYIPYTPIRVNGLFLGLFTIAILIIAQKEALQKDTTLSVAQLTIIGAVICLIGTILFQFIRSFTIEIDKLYIFVSGVVWVTLFFSIISFFIAFQLKTHRTKMLLLYIGIFIIVMNLIIKLFYLPT
jgi:hypothetical protein